ncbi:MAG: hypothetical protein P8R38_03260, partial [Planctomycetota bacterium]|nr:hypothetical protein [Planctomycetota bacterium]
QTQEKIFLSRSLPMKFATSIVLFFISMIHCVGLQAQSANLEIIGGEGFADTVVTAQILATTDLQTHGFSLGLAHDPAVLQIESLSSIRGGALLQALNANSGPDFFEVNMNPANGSGFTVACITDLFNPFDLLPIMNLQVLLEIDYRIIPSAVVGTISTINFTSALGQPPVQTVMVLELAEVIPTLTQGSILVTEPLFLRGDLNQSGTISLLDGVLLLYRVSGLQAPGSCNDADDINDDGVLTIGDAVYLFQYMFTGGSPIPGSTGQCGPDQTSNDGLDCVEFLACD